MLSQPRMMDTYADTPVSLLRTGVMSAYVSSSESCTSTAPPVSLLTCRLTNLQEWVHPCPPLLSACQAAIGRRRVPRPCPPAPRARRRWPQHVHPPSRPSPAAWSSAAPPCTLQRSRQVRAGRRTCSSIPRTPMRGTRTWSARRRRSSTRCRFSALSSARRPHTRCSAESRTLLLGQT
jgi:hypothetical protein